jgi:hypothetical protein
MIDTDTAAPLLVAADDADANVTSSTAYRYRDTVDDEEINVNDPDDEPGVHAPDGYVELVTAGAGGAPGDIAWK